MNRPDRRHRPPAHRAPQRARRDAPAIDHHVYGLHPVAAAFANPARRRRRLLATANALRRLEAQGVTIDVDIEEIEASKLTRLLGPDAVHQGCLLYCDPLDEPTLEDAAAFRRLVVLDQVTDPHNVGAVLRSCAAFSVDALVVTERHSPRETPVLAKSAAGALDLVPIMRVRNLSRALEELASAGFATIGLDSEAGDPLETIPLAEPFALVMGAEGRGLREKTGLTCTALARIDMPGAMPSLNVSNAAALALYVADRRTRGTG